MTRIAEPVSAGAPGRTLPPSPAAAVADHSLVLVVGLSQVTRIVVSKVVERCGLQPLAAEPSGSATPLTTAFPGIVVLDGGAANADCDEVLPTITAMRGVSGGALPGVIMLSNTVGTRDSLGLPPQVDAVVAKPITIERLQSAIDRLSAQLRGEG